MSNTKWALDPTHSEVNFKIKHLMITNVTGSFTKFEAVAETNGDEFESAQITFSADVSGISTNNEQRDGHLQSPDFFDAAQFPKITFQSTMFEKIEGNNYALHGELTIKDVTKSVRLDVECGGIAKDPWGNVKAGFSINGKINRKDFGLNWNAALEAGGVMVSEEVKIMAEIQMVKQ